ncbi:hypothetical protein PtB15_8B389 [Puccinia triticina]|nr:hypothetical protein PtB15_8B389 [Puccinia triticina]
MSPPSSSSRIPPAVHGYEYDPVLNRFFKCPPSGPGRGAVCGTTTVSDRQDGPPLPPTNLKSPSVRRPTRLEFNPETDWASASKRSRHATTISYGKACSSSVKPSHLAFPTQRGGLSGRIVTAAVSNFEEHSNEILVLGSNHSEALLCDFGKLLHRHPSLAWAQVDLSPCIMSGSPEPFTSIASNGGVTCFAATSGCVITTPNPMTSDYEGLPDLIQRASFTNTTWSLCLTPQYLLMGCEKSLAIYDYHRQTVVSQNPKSSVFTIERSDDFNFLLGTRSGDLIQFDIRSPHLLHRNGLLQGRSIYHLKRVDDHQFLVAGTMGYAKLHDIRYLTSDPTMSLDDWDNACDQSFGLTVSKDRNLVCMPGRDSTIKVWDLKSQPVCGFGLQPIATHTTRRIASSVMFVDDFEPEFWFLDGPPTLKRKRPCGPGILFGEEKALYWIGPQAD